LSMFFFRLNTYRLSSIIKRGLKSYQAAFFYILIKNLLLLLLPAHLAFNLFYHPFNHVSADVT